MKKIILAVFFLPCAFFSQIKNMDVPFMEYAYNNSSCSGFRHTTGSLIFIPADAFVTEDGSACSGKIKIRYRELHTRADMLVSGINMILMRGNKRKMLESAGMFEIMAECNGKPMKLAGGKFIQVRMKCERELENLEAFVYDKEKMYWVDAGTAVIDFRYKAKENNANNTNLWGSGQVRPAAVRVANIEGDYISDSAMTKMINNLPDGYFKGMNVKKMGIYNYDAVIKDEKAVPVMAKFKLKTGEEVQENIYVAYIKRNTLICYRPDDMKERFVLLPEKGIRIFCTLKDGSVAVMNQDELDKINIPDLKGKQFTFTLEKVPAKPKDKMAMAEAVKIK